MLKFLLIFFIDITTPAISSTQIACDDITCMQQVLYCIQKKAIFSIKISCRPWLFLEKIRMMLMCILITKLIS